MKQTWRCPQCDNTIVTYVKLSESPTCANHHQTEPMNPRTIPPKSRWSDLDRQNFADRNILKAKQIPDKRKQQNKRACREQDNT